MPYQISNASEMEVISQLVNEVGIKPFFEPKTSNKEKSTWQMSSYYLSEFKPLLTNVVTLFEDEFKKLFSGFKI